MSEGGRGITLRAVAPNAITALALCFGLTAIRYAISASGTDPNPGDWERAIGAIVIAALLDGIDGRVARLLKGESRFGAELDSLSDVIAFGVSPALIIYLWSLQAMPRFGWICALALAVCCALRLARFNAAIDAEIQGARDYLEQTQYRVLKGSIPIKTSYSKALDIGKSINEISFKSLHDRADELAQSILLLHQDIRQ